ncbi:hypothetical protein [Streptomyces lomondensis]|uniref:Uncharacterized protein n=1 Tax=Streptomyces lomondensis TaxID=68229 RepID=A0ABQ2X072_9ACTN|nr:hypothetical protein [Streptomyces lomondensis]MCF0076094.1 hypothetical protein [Streptomyces lomondensis]GGW88852.1 hypothetical protein GCM10010383_17580 [Streptomyces lomondensis]
MRYDLYVWERLVRRLETDWAPCGRYREDLFHRDLKARDALEQLIREAGEAYAGALREVVTRLDRIFTAYTDTKPVRDEEKGRWWWNRVPRRTPW